MINEEQIKYYADQYYQGNEIIPDEEYDALIDQLRKENPKSKLLPENQGITGSDLKGIDKEYKLDISMGTLEKCNTDSQFKEWWSKHPHSDIVIQSKIDGCGTYLHYENGKFKYARSRGNGEYGLDLTDKLLAIGIPQQINVDTGIINIRGEILLKRSIWKEHFSDTKNPRNCVAGLMGRKDIDPKFKYLTFIAYDVFDSENRNIDNSELNKIEFLKSNNFETPECKHNLSLEEIKKWKDSIDTVNSEIPADGVVIKQNKTDKNDLMRHTPLNNIAYKPNLQSAVSTIRKIIWQLQGRYLSPVAIIDPVELEGTTVQRASLANINKMNEKGVYVGAEAVVTKHGMIIPYIDLIINPKKNGFEIPTKCPRCETDLIVNSSGIPECPNKDCVAKTEHQFGRIFEILKVKAAGPAFIEKAAAVCNNMENSFRTLISFISINDVNSFNEWAGGINGEKILKQLREYINTKDKLANKQITTAQYLALFDWPGLSVKQFEKIENLTLDKFFKYIKSELININGIGDEIANEIISFRESMKDQIIDISNFFNIINIEEKKNMDELQTICFTGACPGYTRNQLTEMCSGKFRVVDSVTKDLNILACADPNSGSSKLQKAAKNGTKVISYNELLEML